MYEHIEIDRIYINIFFSYTNMYMIIIYLPEYAYAYNMYS